MRVDIENRLSGFLDSVARQDNDGILAYLAVDARLEFPNTLEVSGRTGIRGFLETVRRNLAAIGVQEVEFRPLRHVTQGHTSFVEWECEGRRAAGPLLFRGVFVGTWNEEGLLASILPYTDPEAVRRMSVGLAGRTMQERDAQVN